MATMYGPAFDESGHLVQREVPEADVNAFEAAGYRKGVLPDNMKPTDAERKKAQAEAQAKADAEVKKAEDAEKATAKEEAKADETAKPKVK